MQVEALATPVEEILKEEPQMAQKDPNVFDAPASIEPKPAQKTKEEQEQKEEELNGTVQKEKKKQIQASAAKSAKKKHKKVKFDSQVTQNEYEPLTSEEEEEQESEQKSPSSHGEEEGEEEMSNDLSLKDRPYSNDGYSMANIAKLEEEEEEAFKEHEYLMKKLKKRSRAGNIFIDKVADVLSAHFNSDTGEIEYLVEWGYNLKD